MDTRNISHNDPQYNMHSSGSVYPQSIPAPQRRLGSQQGTGNEMHEDLYSQGFVPSSFTPPSLHLSQQSQSQEWYKGSQSQVESANHSFALGNTSSGMSIDAYSRGQNAQFSDDQNSPKAQANKRHDQTARETCSSKLGQSGLRTDDQRQNFRRQAADISNSSPVEKRHPGRPTADVVSTQIPGERARFRKIGIVYCNDEVKEFRYFCHIEGCSNASCGRPQELKRHWDSFHENSIIWCPIRGCERSKAIGTNPFPEARKDKLKDHARNVHDIDLEL